jgi:hypothetical protein
MIATHEGRSLTRYSASILIQGSEFGDVDGCRKRRGQVRWPPSEFASEPSHHIERELTVLHTGRRVIDQRTHFSNDDDSAPAELERDTLTASGR